MTEKNVENNSRPQENSDNNFRSSLADNTVKDLYNSLSDLTKNEKLQPTPSWLPNAASLLSNDNSNGNANGNANGKQSDTAAGKPSDAPVGPKIGDGDTRTPEQRRKDDAKQAADILAKRGDMGNQYQRQQIEQMYKRAFNEGGQEAVDKLTEEINKQLEEGGSDVRIDSETRPNLKAGEDGNLSWSDEINLTVTQDGEVTDEASIDMPRDDDQKGDDDDMRKRRRFRGNQG